MTRQGLEIKAPSFQMVLMTWHFPTSRITPADHPCRLAQATCGPSPRKPQPHKGRSGEVWVAPMPEAWRYRDPPQPQAYPCIRVCSKGYVVWKELEASASRDVDSYSALFPPYVRPWAAPGPLWASVSSSVLPLGKSSPRAFLAQTLSRVYDPMTSILPVSLTWNGSQR